MKLRDSFHPYAITTIVFWSIAFVLTRLALQHFSAFSLGFLRYLVASCTLIAIAILIKMKLPHKSDLPWFLASGAIGFFFYMIAFNIGEETVTASTGSIVIATVPVITALLSRIVYKEKLYVYQLVAIAFEFIGVLVLTLMDGVFSINIGLLWLLLAALLLSIYNLLQRKLTKVYTALQTSAFSIFFGTILLAMFLPSSINEVSNAPGMQLVYVAALGIFSSAIAYVAWSKAFSKANQTSQVSNYMFITPFLTSVLGILIMDEVPSSSTLLGGTIIILGVLIFNFGGKMYISIRNKISIVQRNSKEV